MCSEKEKTEDFMTAKKLQILLEINKACDDGKKFAKRKTAEKAWKGVGIPQAHPVTT